MHTDGMSQINPFVPAIASTPQAQRQAAVERSAQVRKTAQKLRTSGYAVEHQDEYVENVDAVKSASDDRKHEQQSPPKRQPKQQGDEGPPDDVPHLDVQA